MDVLTHSVAATGTGSPTMPDGSSLGRWNATSLETRTISSWTNLSTSSVQPAITAPSLNRSTWTNATECWPAYWSYTSALQAYLDSNVQIATFTNTYTYSTTAPTPSTPHGNISYSTLCDGLPRFNSPDDASAAFAPVTLPTPVAVTVVYVSTSYKWPSNTLGPTPTCTIKDQKECKNIWGMFATSLQNMLSTWSSTNLLTVSLASPATAIVIDDITTPLATPVVTLHNETYSATANTYDITGALNLFGETTLTPGAEAVLTWNYDEISSKPFGPLQSNCNRPSGKIIESQCSTAQCTITARHVELLYFAPPSTTRDLCANTKVGFNSYSVSYFSQSHASTVINSTTYWSDKAYVRYTQLSAYKYCSLDNLLGATAVPVGQTYSTNVIEVSSADISSICDWKFAEGVHLEVIGATAKPLNFADLEGDIPASAYQCMQRCQSLCQSIVTPYFTPALAVPRQVRDLDPEWASCVPYFEGVPDPPIALGSVSFLASTTTNTPVKTEPPKPGETSKAAGPAPTKEPQSAPQQPVTVPFTRTIPLPSQQPVPTNDPKPAPANDPGNSVSASSAGLVAVQTRPLPWQAQSQAQPKSQPTTITTIGGHPIVADPSSPGTILISDPKNPGHPQTLTAGGQPIVISATTLSVSTTGNLVVSGQHSLVPLTTIGGQTLWLDPSQPGILLVGNPSAPTQTIPQNGPAVVIDGTTISLSTEATQAPSTVIDGVHLTLLPDGTLKLDDGRILKPGDAQISIQGHSIAMDANGTVMVDGKPFEIDPQSAGYSKFMVLVRPDGTTTTIAIPTATDAAQLAKLLLEETASVSATEAIPVGASSQTVVGSSGSVLADSVFSNSITRALSGYGGVGVSATGSGKTKSGGVRNGCSVGLLHFIMTLTILLTMR